MEELTGFSMKDCLSVPGLGLKNFKNLRTEEDEPIYTYNDKYLRNFVRQAAYGGRICAFNQYFKSKHCVDFLKIVNKELAVKDNKNVYETIQAYMKYKTNISKSLKKNMKINIMIIEMEILNKKKNIFMKD